MTASEARADGAVDLHERDGLEFGRVVNLSDAVFAIAITVLVLTIEVPDVAPGELAGALRQELPQLAAYALAFALVASQWYLHHKLCSRLATMERGFVLLNLVYLGLVALVPLPTGVFGRYPTSTAAVAPFLGLFVLLYLVVVALVVRVHAVDAWREPLPPDVYVRLLRSFVAGIGVLVAGMVVAIWLPLVAVALAVVSGVPTVVLMRHAPPAYRAWL